MKNNLTTLLASFALLVISPLITQAQQKASIQGHVKDTENKPLPGTTISIDGTNYITSAGNKGDFKLDVAAGKYTIHYNFVGFREISKQIVIAPGAVIDEN